MTDALIPIRQACRLLRISDTLGYKLNQEDKFPVEVVPLGRKLFVRRVDLESFLGTALVDTNNDEAKGWICPVCLQSFKRKGKHMRLHPEFPDL